MRLFAFVASAVLLSSHQLIAADMPSTAAAYRYYIGLGAGQVHHVGYAPDRRSGVEQWRTGGKAFGGMTVFEWVKVETTYFYFGRANFFDGAGQATEQSHAVAATALICCLPLHELIHSPWPIRMFGRMGGAYKWILQRPALGGAFDEGGVSYVLGFGAEADITRSMFVRFDYEYISKIISGTNRANDVQHTPLTLSLGLRF